MDSVITSFPPAQFGRSLPLGLREGRLRLVLQNPPQANSPGSSVEPFVRLEGVGAVGEAFLGALSGPGFEERPVTIVIASDQDAPIPPEAGSAGVAGRFWFRKVSDEFRSLTQLTVPVLSFLDLGTSDDGQVDPVLPPLWYCKRRQLLFVPPCPQCGDPLEECGDDSLLKRHGLHPDGSTSRRYVYCPACAGGDGDDQPRFFQKGAPSAAARGVGDAAALVEGFGRLVAVAPEAGNPGFPCQGCSFNHGCYPVEDGVSGNEAGSLLLPLTFYGGPILFLEFLPMFFGEACDLLGGRAGEEVQAAVASRLGAGAGLAGPALPADGRTAFLYPDGPGGRTALEVLFLKLYLFEQVCRGVEAVHRTLRRPHLDLRPQTVWATIGENDGPAPSLWGLRSALAGLGSAQPVAVDAEAELRLEPPDRFDLVYSHPAVSSGSRSGEWVPATFRVSSVDPSAEAEPGACIVVGQLDRERIPAGMLETEGPVRIRLGKGLGFRTEVALSCRGVGGVGEGVLLRSEPVALDPLDHERLLSLSALPSIEVSCSVTRRFGVECDLFSLGMLLLRALLVNCNQGEGAVSRHCRIVADDLGAGANSVEPDGGAGSVLGKLGERMASDRLLDSRNLRYAPGEDAESAVPPELWRRAVAVGFRLITRIQGFSFGGLEEGAGGGSGADTMERVVRDVRVLREDVRQALLFWQPPPEPEIRDVLQDLIDDPGWLDAVLGRAAETGGALSVSSPAPKEAVPEREQSPSPAPIGTEVFEETVILRPGATNPAMAAKTDQRSMVDGSSVAGSESEARFDETVILKPAGQRFPDPGSEAGGPGQGKGPAGTQQSPAPSRATPIHSSGEDLESTVILKPGKTRQDIPEGKQSGGEQAGVTNAPARGGEKPSAEEADFEKTIILRPGQKSLEEDQ